jgi:hypothetical protein
MSVLFQGVDAAPQRDRSTENRLPLLHRVAYSSDFKDPELEMRNLTGTDALTNPLERVTYALPSTDIGAAGVVSSKRHP